jgi:hypothetical protein
MQIVEWSLDNSFIDIIYGPEIALKIYDYLYVFSHHSGENKIFISKLDQEHNVTTWTTVDISSDIPIVGATFFYNQQRLYIIGGTIDGKPTNSVYYASIKTNRTLGSIKRSRNLSFCISHATIAECDGSIYLFGGMDENKQAVADIHEIKFTDSGILKSIDERNERLPVPLYNSTSLVYKNNIYLFGGNTGHFPSANIVRITYDHISNKLIINSNSSLPIALEKPSIGQLGDKVYVIGGKKLDKDNHYKVSIDTYISMFTNTGNLPRWSKDLSLPYEIANACVVENKSSFYIIGGLVNNLKHRIVIHPRFYDDVKDIDDNLDSTIKKKLVNQVRFLNIAISLLVLVIIGVIIFFSII